MGGVVGGWEVGGVGGDLDGLADVEGVEEGAVVDGDGGVGPGFDADAGF